MDAPSDPSRRAIRFGTSGWRGVAGEDVQFDALEALCGAIAEWVLRQDAGCRIVLGHDTRLLSERMAQLAAHVLAEAGCEVLASHEPVPTPALTHAIAGLDAAAGVMITASHNPPEYHGVKVFGHWGGTIGDDDARAIESLAAARERRPVVAPEAWTVAGVQLLDRYRSDLLDVLDREALAGADFTVLYDAMHGVGAGVLDGVLEEAGCQVERMRIDRDPGFGGQPPDPVAAHLAPLVRSVKRTGGPCLGLATDGDADRFAVVEPGGRLLTETEACALLVDHLARTGRISRGLALGAATGSLVARVAESHGLAVSRWPIGFKYLSQALLDGAADVAGDESGGFAWARLGRDKDGILAGALMAELMATEPGAIGERLRGFERRFGRLSCARRALPASPKVRAALEQLLRSPPDQLGADRVRDASVQAGALRLELEDGFAYVRTSGTEPRVRVYAEGPGPGALAERLDQLEALLGKSAPAAPSED